MSNLYFEVYRDDTMRLVRSIVIKFEACATILNERLAEEGIIADPTEPTTWKYYMNMAGEYHSSDTMMRVRSMDTLEIIDFTKDNLEIHRATAREYYPGSIYYNNLAFLYPDQTSLINGIIFPIDIQHAIDSKDGEVLYYDPTYIDENEDNLPHEIQDWVTVTYERWYNQQYNISDDLYFTGLLGNLYSQLPLAVMLIRLRNARTPRAHSFFIREALASNSRLDEFMPYLDKGQQLHLYRDINWYERNWGKEDTWNRLVDNILTPRGIPLIWYNIRQNSSDMPEQMNPKAELVKLDVNFPIVKPNQDKIELSELLAREDPLARDNAINREDAEREDTEAIIVDKFSSLPTKVLDSEVIDRSTSSVRSHMNVLLNEWLDLSTRGKYRAYILVPHPRTGELLSLSVKDAFILMLYAYIQYWEWDVPNIPTAIAYEVLRDPLPTLNELKTYVSNRVVPQGVLTAIQDRVYPMRNYISTEQFYLDATRAHKSYIRLWELYSFQQNKDARAQTENAVKANYMNRRCTFVEETTSFDDYFLRKGIDVRDLRKTEYGTLVTDCINIATGSNLFKVITLGDVQRELLRLMKRLSSFPLQYLRNVAYTNFHVIGNVGIRVGDYLTEATNEVRVNVGDTTVMTYTTSAKNTVKITAGILLPGPTLRSNGTLFAKVNPCIGVRYEGMERKVTKLTVDRVGLMDIKFIADNSPPVANALGEYRNSTDPNYPDM